jgi:formylglycine-generating enzyme required for sulfatase activity
MHGNVREWCADFFDDAFYRVSPTDDPAGPACGPRRVQRGGSFVDPSTFCRSAMRLGDYPDEQSRRVGFRVVEEWGQSALGQ